MNPRVQYMLVDLGFTRDKIKECITTVALANNITTTNVANVLTEIFIKKVVVICSDPYDDSFKEAYEDWRKMMVKYYNNLVVFDFFFVTADLELNSILKLTLKPVELHKRDRVVDVIHNEKPSLMDQDVQPFDVVWFCGCGNMSTIEYHLATIEDYIYPETVLMFSETRGFSKKYGTERFLVYTQLIGDESEKTKGAKVIDSFFVKKEGYPFFVHK